MESEDEEYMEMDIEELSSSESESDVYEVGEFVIEEVSSDDGLEIKRRHQKEKKISKPKKQIQLPRPPPSLLDSPLRNLLAPPPPPLPPISTQETLKRIRPDDDRLRKAVQYKWPIAVDPPLFSLSSAKTRPHKKQKTSTTPLVHLSPFDVSTLTPLMSRICTVVGVPVFQQLLKTIRLRTVNQISNVDYKNAISSMIPMMLLSDVNMLVRSVFQITAPRAVAAMQGNQTPQSSTANEIFSGNSVDSNTADTNTQSMLTKAGKPRIRSRNEWTLEEDMKFLELLKKYKTNYKEISKWMPGRTTAQIRCHYRYYMRVVCQGRMGVGKNEKRKSLKERGRPHTNTRTQKFRTLNEEEKKLVKAFEIEIFKIEDEKRKVSTSAWFNESSQILPKIARQDGIFESPPTVRISADEQTPLQTTVTTMTNSTFSQALSSSQADFSTANSRSKDIDFAVFRPEKLGILEDQPAVLTLHLNGTSNEPNQTDTILDHVAYGAEIDSNAKPTSVSLESKNVDRQIQTDPISSLSLFKNNETHAMHFSVAMPLVLSPFGRCFDLSTTLISPFRGVQGMQGSSLPLPGAWIPTTPESAIVFGPTGVPLLSLPIPLPGMTVEDYVGFIGSLSTVMRKRRRSPVVKMNAATETK